MSAISIFPITKEIVLRYDGGRVLLPDDLQQEIDTYWEGLLRSGKRYTRGEVYTVTGRTDSADRMTVSLTRTVFAHNLFCRDVGSPEGYDIRIIHSAALVETSDGKVVFGKMGPHTANARRYQLCGGGIDGDDLRGDIFDLDHNTRKELREELGIDADDADRVLSFAPAYLKQGGPREKMSVIYRVVLSETAGQCLARYEAFAEGLRKSGVEPEFAEIVVFDRKSEELLEFLSRSGSIFDEYMRPLFEFIASETVSG